MSETPPFDRREYTLNAGQFSYPKLIRVQRNGLAVFEVCGEHTFEVVAGTGEQIPEGDSDFCGSVLSVDFKSQSVRIRSYDLSRRIQSAEQVSGGNGG